MGDNVVEDGADVVLEEVRQFFVELNEWVPILGHFLEMIMEWPEARHERLFDLADSYRAATELYGDHLDEISGYLRDLETWRGDGAAALVRDQLRAHIDEVGGMAEALGSMHELVRGKALEIESMKWMAVINLVMLGIAIVQMLITAWTGVGALIGAGEIAFTRAAISLLAKRLLTKLWEETVKGGVRGFVQGGVKGVATTALRSGLVYSGFILASEGGITLIQALEGHDPFTKDFAGRFAMQVADGFIAGSLGGPLTLGIHNRLTEAIAFGVGQLGDNVVQIGRDRALDAAGLRDWAQRNGLYSGMTWDQLTSSLTTAALLSSILTDTRGVHHLDPTHLPVRVGPADLLGGHGADSPSAAHRVLPGDLAAPELPRASTGLADGSPSASPIRASSPSDGPLASGHVRAESSGSAIPAPRPAESTPSTTRPEHATAGTERATVTPERATGVPEQHGASTESGHSATTPDTAEPRHSTAAQEHTAESGQPTATPAPAGEPVHPTAPPEQTVAGSRADAASPDSGTVAVDRQSVLSSVDAELAPSVNFPPHITRSGADLPQQVHELVDRASANLLERYPAETVAARIRDLADVGAVADRLQVAAASARSGGDIGDVVQRVRELSAAVNEYSDRYRDWRDFTPDAAAHRQSGEFADPGWRDLDGVDPLNSVEMANRVAAIDPATGRFHPVDAAIAIAKIGDVLGPEFEAHAARIFERTVPMDMDSVRAVLPAEAITARIEELVTTGRPRGFYDPELGVMFIDHMTGGGPRSISAIAATIVHEGIHALQPNNALLGRAIDAIDLPDGPTRVRARLLFEREYQGFAVQQHFLRGLAGFRSPEPSIDPRIPQSDGYRELAAMTPEQLRDQVLSRYISDAVRIQHGMDAILTEFPDLTPENIVSRARMAIVDSTHPLSHHREQGTLYGPITQRIVDTHGLDLDGLRRRQEQLSFPTMRDPSPVHDPSPQRDPSSPRDPSPVHDPSPQQDSSPQHDSSPDGLEHELSHEPPADPPWARDGGSPSLAELIPRTNEELAAWEGAIRQALADQVGGFEHAGARTRIDLSDANSVSVYRDSVTVRPEIVHPGRGVVGQATLTFRRDEDGTLVVRYNTFDVNKSFRGNGFVREFINSMERWFRESGVSYVEVRAAATVGGYFWARVGFDWSPHARHHATAILDRLRTEVGKLDADLAAVRRWLAGGRDVNLDPIRALYREDNPEVLLDEMTRQRAGAVDILNRAARHQFGEPGYPTPGDVSRAGWGGEQGPDGSWIGKRAMLTSLWEGVRVLDQVDPAGVDHPSEAITRHPGRSEQLTATSLAAASRTIDGMVDPGALADFVRTVPHLDAAGPGGMAGALGRFTAAALGRDDLVLRQLDGGAGKGQSGAPVFLVRDESGTLVAIAKVFPQVEELVRELSAIHRLGADDFTRFRVPEVLGTAVADLPGTTADQPTRTSGALIMSVAPGRSLFDMIAELPGRESHTRPLALAELTQAVRDSATALAELHSRPAGSGGAVDRGFLDFNHGLALRETAAVLAHGEVLRVMGLDSGELRVRVEEAIRAALVEPGGAAVMHGDAHPGNIFWDPVHGVTLIDTPHAHFSMDVAGAAIGSPARDFSNMVQRLAHFSQEAGLARAEVADLQADFVEAYARGGGPTIPEAARIAFAARFAVRDVLDTLTALAESPMSAYQSDHLIPQLMDEIELLKAALQWTS